MILKNKPRARLFPLEGVGKWLIILGVGFHLAGFLAFRVIVEPEQDPSFLQPFVRLLIESTEAVETLNESALLSDSEPLFLPTRWNAAADLTFVRTRGNRTSPFELFPAEIAMGTDAAAGRFQVSLRVPQNPLEGLALNPSSIFASFGQDFLLEPPSRDRGLMIKVNDYVSGEVRILDTLSLDASIPQLPDQWRFVQFQLSVDPSGSLGQPVLVDGTGDESLDRALGELLLSTDAVAKLRPGYYRIVLGP